MVWQIIIVNLYRNSIAIKPFEIAMKTFFFGMKIRIFLAGGTEAGIYSYGNARKPLHKTDLKLLGQARGGFSSSPFYFVFLCYGILNLNLKRFYNLYHPISVGITIMELTAMKMKVAKNDRPKFS